MLASITPLGERGRGRSWIPTLVGFFLGAAAGGAALGAAAGLAAIGAATVPPQVRWALAGVAAVLLLALDAAGRLPTWRRQVDERWLDDYRGWVVGIGYGAQLGVGVVTVVPTAATWLMLLVAVAGGSFALSVGLGLVFGLARAVPLLAMRSVTSSAALHDAHRRMAALATPVAGGTRIVAAAVVVAVATGALGVAA